jgi:Arc/MetJ-type ribon-helix-helix transcriptional regulator
MVKRSERLDVRLTEQLDHGIRQEAKARGYASASAFVRAAVKHELAGRNSDNLAGAEERLAATIESMRRELFRLGRGQQALFAYVDSLAKVLLTCIPEPPPDARLQAIARAKERHNRLVKSAGSAMVGDSQAAMLDLLNCGEK